MSALVIQKMMIAPLPLYIKESIKVLDNETISKYSEKAAKGPLYFELIFYQGCYGCTCNLRQGIK